MVVLWLCYATLVTALLAYVARGASVMRRGRRGWRPAMVDGERVWLASDVGPALVGAVRPRMGLPLWLLDALDADGARLLLAHERAHAAAGDRLLLACAVPRPVAVTSDTEGAFLWLAFDARGNVARSAVGPDRLTVLDQEEIRRQFPDPADAQVGSYAGMNVPAGRDTGNLLVVPPPTPR